MSFNDLIYNFNINLVSQNKFNCINYLNELANKIGIRDSLTNKQKEKISTILYQITEIRFDFPGVFYIKKNFKTTRTYKICEIKNRIILKLETIQIRKSPDETQESWIKITDSFLHEMNAASYIEKFEEEKIFRVSYDPIKEHLTFFKSHTAPASSLLSVYIELNEPKTLVRILTKSEVQILTFGPSQLYVSSFR